jgi:hypothetical protein
MKRIGLIAVMGSFVLTIVLSGASYATPLVTGATIETRTFNDCPLSVLTTSNNYPASIAITDQMDTLCVGFANLHSFSFSAGGDTAAVFDNNSNFHVAADVSIAGAGEGEGGLRISPWYGKYSDGRFMLNATSGEIAAFGGALPFYSFTVNHGITYTKGDTAHLEVTYLANHLTAASPATIQYRVVYHGVTYDSPVLPFGEQNEAECVHGLWGMLNDGRVGGYFQPRANTGASLTATWANIQFQALPACGTTVATGASIETRTFNDCPLSVLTTSNNYPASVAITDQMDTLCVGFANLHSFSFSAGGDTAAVYDNNSNFHVAADVSIVGAGEGEGGLRISPWYGKYTDGRFMLNATSGEIAAFGGALPFYSFTVNNGITYTKGTTVHLEVTYKANDLTAANPATIQYRVVMNGNTYDSPVLPFGEQNEAECVHGLWGMLNDGRVGGYFQPRANTGASLTATWSNIQFTVLECSAAACVDSGPPTVEVTLDRDSIWPPNHKYVEVCATVNASDDCDQHPAVSLLSVTSNEPDNGKGDGNTDHDIVIEDGNCFLLRAERSGGGNGRVYTIVYCATDSIGQTACDTATVTVAHDQSEKSGEALSSDGFTADGTALLPQVKTFVLVIPSSASFDAKRVDVSNALIENDGGVIAPKNVQYGDANQDGRVDLGLSYDTNELNRILKPGSAAGLRYQVGNDAYVVSDIFRLGPPVEFSGAGTTPVKPTVMRSQPNPFRSSTIIQYEVGDAPGHVMIAVFDASGRRVRTLVNDVQSPGSHVATWDGRRENGERAAAGVYFMKADVVGHQASERIILLK